MSEAAYPSSASVSEPQGLNQIERVVDAFIAPSKTFKDILRSASWWLPFILMVLSATSLAWVVDKQVGYDHVAENVIHQSPKAEDRMSSLSPEQRASSMHMVAMQTRIGAYAAPVFLLIFFAIYALILWASFNFGLGAQTTFWQVFAVSFYAALPYIFINLIAIFTIYFGGSAEAYDMKNPAGTNLGYYLPDVSPWLKALLGQLDVIKLWTLALTVLGMAIVAKKSITQSAVIVVGWWLVLVVIAVGFAAAFS
ncbi:YIP1 family protein [Granulicella tundricola]|uniref:Yip1 domain-containing protein n=1 Tax=Granulicella tundricola (strain ATCC BAA-1859 / DSM 23138 / MP5ACTX9) TaxID=1198114 RepID=E8X4Q8_GRATM|nr:YIP1 family protein [Granulicella tundricola]ADW70547.1 hypothetical protein AciX9_3542 [Granulicella tundricola MP5ACTX9]